MPGLQPAQVFRGSSLHRPTHRSLDAPHFWTFLHRFLVPHILGLFTWLSCMSHIMDIMSQLQSHFLMKASSDPRWGRALLSTP